VKYKLGWFSTGRDKAARDLLRAVQANIKSEKIKAEIQFVFCNRRPAADLETDRFLHLANTFYKLPVLYFSWQDFHKSYWTESTIVERDTTGDQMTFLPNPNTPLQAPRPLLLEKQSFHRHLPRQKRYRRRKVVPLYQIPLLPDELSPLQHDAYEQWRLGYDRQVMDMLERIFGPPPDLCVLAGYMLIVGREMCQKYNMINLHPAVPGGPTGTWQEVTWQLIKNQAQETGAMMHLVTPELDKGPPVSYCTFSIRGEAFDKYWRKIEKLPLEELKEQSENNPLFKLIRKHELVREFPLIVSTLKAFSRGKIKITKDKRVVDSDGRPISGYNLTDEINEQVKGMV
jgi:folate-dependent phosphoribosylglycinamide formyltransferase PurN